jgi:hypothetical protein
MTEHPAMMTKAEFRQQISEVLNATLDSGPGPRAVAFMTADALAQFIMNEAGGDAPAAVEEAIECMHTALRRAVDA